MLEKLNKRIVDFIKDHHVLTLATSNNDIPYCANCFYAYMPEKNVFIFTSDMETKHVQDVLKQNKVAASIVLETKIVGKIQGLQINGNLVLAKNEMADIAKKAYVKKYPFAKLLKTTLWILDPTFYKFTDNRLGFGKKIIWRIINE